MSQTNTAALNVYPTPSYGFVIKISHQAVFIIAAATRQRNGRTGAVAGRPNFANTWPTNSRSHKNKIVNIAATIPRQSKPHSGPGYHQSIPSDSKIIPVVPKVVPIIMFRRGRPITSPAWISAHSYNSNNRFFFHNALPISFSEDACPWSCPNFVRCGNRGRCQKFCEP